MCIQCMNFLGFAGGDLLPVYAPVNHVKRTFQKHLEE